MTRRIEEDRGHTQKLPRAKNRSALKLWKLKSAVPMCGQAGSHACARAQAGALYRLTATLHLENNFRAHGFAMARGEADFWLWYTLFSWTVFKNRDDAGAGRAQNPGNQPEAG